MKIAVIGSRNVFVENLKDYLPADTTEIVSGGAKGVDQCAKEYAKSNNIKITEFLPEYERFKKFAPLKRNKEIVNYADEVLAFWDGKSKGTKYVIDLCHKTNKKITIILR